MTDNGRETNTGIDNIQTGNAVPEPGETVLVAIGLLALLWVQRRA